MKDDKTEAMDNLIAQDADLIEICPDDLVRRLKGHSEIMERDKGKVVRFIDVATCTEAVDRIEAQAAEISKWHTVTRAYLDRIETLRAYNERLNKSAECLAESRRLAVKDLAVLEEHMRLEIGQWKVDYDCAIMDVEHLRDRIEAQAAEIERLTDLLRRVVNLAEAYATGTGEAFNNTIAEARAALEQST